MAQAMPGGIAVIRTLMDQYGLTLSDLPEIGSKSMVSRVLSGKRKLTLEHAKNWQRDSVFLPPCLLINATCRMRRIRRFKQRFKSPAPAVFLGNCPPCVQLHSYIAAAN